MHIHGHVRMGKVGAGGSGRGTKEEAALAPVLGRAGGFPVPGAAHRGDAYSSPPKPGCYSHEQMRTHLSEMPCMRFHLQKQAAGTPSARGARHCQFLPNPCRIQHHSPRVPRFSGLRERGPPLPLA